MIVIAFTAEHDVPEEAQKIVRLLDAGVDYVHIRKPHSSKEEVENLIRSIPAEYHPRLKLHDRFEMLDQYNLGGIHLNSRNGIAPNAATKVSKSLHSFEELDELGENNGGYEYVTLSPIYNSISKKGYNANFDLESVANHIRGKRVVALGGITPAHFAEIEEKEFYGAALLGYIWNGDFEESFRKLSGYIAKKK